MKRFVAFLLLAILSLTSLGAARNKNPRMTPEQNARQSREAAKKQQKFLNKANKKQRKAAKKFEKRQRKETREANKNLRKRRRT